MALLLIAMTVAMPAQARVYVYTGNNAMAKMMLDFLEAMGFIHRLPDRYAASLLSRYRYPGLSGFPTTSLWGLSPYGGMSSLAAPLAMGSMLSQPGFGGWPGMAGMGAQPWNGALGGLNGLYNGVNNGIGSLTPPTSPLSGGNGNGQIQMSVDELQRLLDSRRESGDSGGGSITTNRPTITSSADATTTFDRLTGLWMGKNRDILTITGNRFIWTDPSGRITKGSFRLEGDRMLVQVDGATAPAVYRIRQSGDRMVATNQAGFSYEFTRSKAKAK